MKPGPNPNKQRSRGRPNGGGGGGGGGGNGGGGGGGGGKKYMPPRNQTFDSNGPEIRIRGNAHQVLEKYLALARDCSAQGDRIAAENYYQHAEHYFRVINNQNQNGQRNGPRPMSTPADDHSLLAGDLDNEDGEGGSSGENENDGDNNGNNNDGEGGDDDRNQSPDEERGGAETISA
jgi:hypothetical protein